MNGCLVLMRQAPAPYAQPPLHSSAQPDPGAAEQGWQVAGAGAPAHGPHGGVQAPAQQQQQQQQADVSGHAGDSTHAAASHTAPPGQQAHAVGGGAAAAQPPRTALLALGDHLAAQEAWELAQLQVLRQQVPDAAFARFVLTKRSLAGAFGALAAAAARPGSRRGK